MGRFSSFMIIFAEEWWKI